MSEMPPTQSEISSDDRLWALLSYLVPIIIPIIVMLMEDKKNRPFIKAHSVQALVLGIALFIIASILALIPFIQCISPLVYILLIIYGIQAYQGKYVNIPVITDFVKKQGWA